MALLTLDHRAYVWLTLLACSLLFAPGLLIEDGSVIEVVELVVLALPIVTCLTYAISRYSTLKKN